MAEAPNAPTRSLRASANPQARMQELLRRDVPTLPHEEALLSEDINATALPDSCATSSAVAQIPSSADSSLTENQRDNEGSEDPPQATKPPRQKRRTGSANAKAAQPQTKTENNAERASHAVAQTTSSAVAHIPSSAVGSVTGSNPVHDAMLAMLALPYPSDMENGQMTVTTVKIPKPLWERLEYARTVTKRDKQDIIAAAIRLYFEKIVEGNVK